jgi:hypothetical protein
MSNRERMSRRLALALMNAKRPEGYQAPSAPRRYQPNR